MPSDGNRQLMAMPSGMKRTTFAAISVSDPRMLPLPANASIRFAKGSSLICGVLIAPAGCGEERGGGDDSEGEQQRQVFPELSVNRTPPSARQPQGECEKSGAQEKQEDSGEGFVAHPQPSGIRRATMTRQ